MGTQTKTTTNRWKEKAKDRGKKLRRAKEKIKRQHGRAEKWKRAYYDLKSRVAPSKVKHHKYPLELIWMAVLMSINYNISLRGVSNSIAKMGELFGLKIERISPVTIRNWVLKYGIHCLLQPIEKGKYIIISDESVEIGREHLLLLLVVPIEKCSRIHPLCFEDVIILDLKVQQSWKGSEITDMIKKKIEEHEIELVYGISDKGHTLLKAYKNLNIPWIGDCTHEIANQTQLIFKKNDLLKDFTKHLPNR